MLYNLYEFVDNKTFLWNGNRSGKVRVETEYEDMTELLLYVI